ncbi:MAG: hypothetical protein ACOYYJ_21030 [Chloroflexota bacterium]
MIQRPGRLVFLFDAAQTALELIRWTPRRLPLVDALIAAAACSRAAVLVHRDEYLRALPAEQV